VPNLIVEIVEYLKLSANIEYWKTVAETFYYVVAIGAALGAVLVYRRNSRLERAKWTLTLYEKFLKETISRMSAIY
jgi:hypothetical protein